MTNHRFVHSVVTKIGLSQRVGLIMAAWLVMLVIWVRPSPVALYGVDASCYALVAANMAPKPKIQWIDMQLSGHSFVEHPPGFVVMEAIAFQWFGASTQTAVMTARALSTMTALLMALVAYKIAGQAAAVGTLLMLPTLAGFLFESQNPMLEMPLCAGLLLAMLGVLCLGKDAKRGTCLFVVGTLFSFWIKGPPAFASLCFLAWFAVRRRVSWQRSLGVGALTLLCIVVSGVAFDGIRAQYGLPSFFASYWQQQVMPSFFLGRHNPVDSPWFYVPIVWRWQAVGVMVSVPACMIVWRRRRQAPKPALLAEVALVWGIVLFAGFTLARQKYQWYLHPMAPSFAWLGGAALTSLSSPSMSSSIKRWGAVAGFSLGIAYLVLIAMSPNMLRTRRPLLDALHAAPAPLYLDGEPHTVAYCHPHLWRENHVARFLWQAELVPCDADAPYRFKDLVLTRTDR